MRSLILSALLGLGILGFAAPKAEASWLSRAIHVATGTDGGYYGNPYNSAYPGVTPYYSAPYYNTTPYYYPSVPYRSYYYSAPVYQRGYVAPYYGHRSYQNYGRGYHGGGYYHHHR